MSRCAKNGRAYRGLTCGCRHYELISKYDTGLKQLLPQGLSVPEFYGGLVYKFRKIVGKSEFSDYCSRLAIRYKRKGYIICVIKQSTFLANNPFTVDHFVYLFNCTPLGRDSDSMMAST